LKMMRSKIKFMTTKPDITEDEIREAMDFGEVLALSKAAIKTRQRVRTGLIVAGAIIIGVIAYRWLSPVPEQKTIAVSPTTDSPFHSIKPAEPKEKENTRDAPKDANKDNKKKEKNESDESDDQPVETGKDGKGKKKGETQGCHCSLM